MEQQPPGPGPFDHVVAEHGALVLAVLTRVVGPHDAQDCWQETFLAALGAWPRLRPDSNVRGWLVTIAHRKAVDSLRARGRRREVGDADLAQADPSSYAVPDPADGVAAALDGRELWAAVDALPPKQRVAVVCRYAADLGYDDIAAVLGGSRDAARRSVSDGLSALRRHAAARREW